MKFYDVDGKIVLNQTVTNISTAILKHLSMNGCLLFMSKQTLLKLNYFNVSSIDMKLVCTENTEIEEQKQEID